jgi:diguanylate cyclase (GGDEF)-like protein/PAS domain S-box-containing protein
MPTPLRVLILTDQSDQADLLARELRDAGFTLESQRVNTPEDFELALDTHRPAPDVILADCALERIDVMTALRLVQSRDRRIPFLLVCDTVSDETIAGCIRLGAVDVVTRERLPQLAETVAHALTSPQHSQDFSWAEAAPVSAPGHARAQSEQTQLVFYNESIGPGSHTQYVSPQVSQLLGYSQAEWLADPDLWLRSLHPHDFDHVLREKGRSRRRSEPFHAEYRIRARDGHILWVHDEAIPVPGESGKPVWMRGILRDITERKQAKTQPQYSGVHDVLTGLYNRLLLETELARLAHGRQFPVSIIMADVDGLQAINERYNHDMGDEALQRIARVLRLSFRAEDIIARVGEDEFAVALCNTDVDAAAKAVARVHSALSADNALHPELPLSLSLGAIAVENGEGLAESLKEAKTLMLKEKAQKRKRGA